jgi:flagellar hook-associated protein 1 FlgK
MDTGLSIAASALNATTAEIDATSENIANSQTVGYASETANLAALPGGSSNGVGDGVQVTSISQVTNALLSANNIQAQGTLSSLGSSQQVLTGIQDVFPLGQAASSSSTTVSSNSSIAGQLATFWSSWDSIAQDPSGSSAGTQVVDEAQGMATSLNEAATQLSQLSTNTQAQLSTDVAQVNTLLTQAASLNGSIVTSSGGGASPNQLTDQLNNVVGQLSSLAGVSVTMQPDGTARIYIGSIGVVQGTQASTLGVTSTTSGSSTTYGLAAYPTAADAATATDGVATPVASGSISGELAGINTSIPQYQAQLNDVANALASTVNGQLALGYTQTGASGASYPLFEEGGVAGAAVTAAGITVNQQVADNPALLATSGSTGTDVGAVLPSGQVTTPESLTVTQGGVAASYPTTGESLANVAAGLNAAFAATTPPLSMVAEVTNGGTQLALTSTTSSGAGSFTVTSSASGTGTTGLAPSTPTNFTPASVGANDGSNAQAMAELGTSATGPDVAYQNLVEGIGSDVQNVNTQVSAQTSVANQAQQALQAVTGVNTDTQLTELMQYQSNYQASAKLVSVIDTTMQALLAAV